MLLLANIKLGSGAGAIRAGTVLEQPERRLGSRRLRILIFVFQIRLNYLLYISSNQRLCENVPLGVRVEEVKAVFFRAGKDEQSRKVDVFSGTCQTVFHWHNLKASLVYCLQVAHFPYFSFTIS